MGSEGSDNTTGDPERVEVAGFVVDLRRRVLLNRQGQVVALRPQAYEVLGVLARQPGRLVTKDELLAAVWPGLVVTEDSVVQAIGDVRRALGAAGHRVVKTVARRGYMLLPEAEAAPAPHPRRRRWALLMASLAALAVLGSVIGWQLHVPRRGAAEQVSIAVLPFKSGTPGHPDDGVIALDIASELVSELARSPSLRVISSQSSFRFSTERDSPALIGQRLRSRYLVDGSARRSGEDELRITVELLESDSGRHIWSTAYVASRSTLGATRREIVGRIAGTLQSRVARFEERLALSDSTPKTLDIFVLTARGKAMMQRYNAEGMREARRYLKQALAADPEYAPAWAYLAMTDTIDMALRLSGERDRSHGPEVMASVQRALTLQPDLTAAHVALSQAHGVLGEYEASLAAAQRCLQLSPNDAACFYVLGAAQLRLGASEAAAANLGHALDRNPFPPAFLPAFYGTALWAARRYDEALSQAGDCLSLAPDFTRCQMDRIAVLAESGRIEDARKEAAALRGRLPQLAAQNFAAGFSDKVMEAQTLRERRLAAAKASGF